MRLIGSCVTGLGLVIRVRSRAAEAKARKPSPKQMQIRVRMNRPLAASAPGGSVIGARLAGRPMGPWLHQTIRPTRTLIWKTRQTVCTPCTQKARYRICAGSAWAWGAWCLPIPIAHTAMARGASARRQGVGHVVYIAWVMGKRKVCPSCEGSGFDQWHSHLPL